MDALNRSLRFRDFSLIKRNLKLRTILLGCFLLMMCLIAPLMSAGGFLSDDDLSGMFFGIVIAAFLAAFLTNVEYDADKADEDAGWKRCRLAFPYSGTDHAAARYQIKTVIMFIYGGLLFLCSVVISALCRFSFTGTAINCYLLFLCLLELSCIVRRSAGMLLHEHRQLKRILIVPASLLLLLWVPSLLRGLLQNEPALPDNTDPITYLAEHIGALYITLLTFVILCGLLYVGRKVTALEFDRRDS
ncbi:MAG: ABC-2 transporter permease [Oscillospiraceae bacterium]|nr:ABC-2 transporter permease [Oscillospiraceae bacterium]